jgi:hypothetical protein
MKKPFLELSPIFIIFGILNEIWIVIFMFEKEHKNNCKKTQNTRKTLLRFVMGTVYPHL